MMRITNQSVASQVADDLQQAYRRVTMAQEAVSTGRRINRLSDDPLGAARALGLRAFISSLDQYEKNIDRALPQLEQADATLANGEEVLTRAKELALASANDTQSATERAETATEVHQLYQQLLDLANTKVEGRYIFAGFKTTTVPFSTGAGTTNYQGDDGVASIQINGTSVAKANVPGDQIFQGVAVVGGTDIFDSLMKLEDALKSNNVKGPTGIEAQLDRLDSGIDQFLNFRAEIGARINGMNGARDSVGVLKLQSESQRSQLEDADALKAYSDFARFQQAFEASLNSAARTLEPTLLDFLR